jgi:multiple sugar transport system substrate-binding protein
MTMADFGQPVIDIPPEAGGFNTDALKHEAYRPMIDSEAGLAAAEYLMELLQYSPPDILSMSWYERIGPTRRASRHGLWLHIACALFRARRHRRHMARPASCRIRHGPQATPVAPVGGYAMGIPANLPPSE